MQAVVELPGAQQIHRVVEPDFDVLHRRERAESCVPLQMEKAVEPVNDHAHLHAALRRCA